MCCEAASVAKRGSRFVGLDSRRNVSELRLVDAFEEQDEQNEQNEAMKQRSSEVTRREERRTRRGWVLFTASLADGGIKPGFLHCASRRVRGSEREEKASARFGRNDNDGAVWTNG